MNTYTMLSECKPEPNKEIKYIDSDNNTGFAYLCPCCLNEWRCPITGSGLLIDVVQWKYYEGE